MSNATALSNEDRIKNYLRQMGGRRLSSRQERRIWKHANRSMGYTRDAPMDEFVEVGPPVAEPTVTPAARPCGGTDYCITGSGAKAKKTHVKCENL